MENATAVGEASSRACARSRSATRSSREVRGRALWIGVSFADHDQAAAVEQAAFRRGLLVLGCGDDAIRISPPLVFREDQAAPRSRSSRRPSPRSRRGRSRPRRRAYARHR